MTKGSTWGVLAALVLSLAGMSRAAGVPLPLMTRFNDLACLMLPIALLPVVIGLGVSVLRTNCPASACTNLLRLSVWVLTPVWLYCAAWMFLFVATALEDMK